MLISGPHFGDDTSGPHLVMSQAVRTLVKLADHRRRALHKVHVFVGALQGRIP